MKLRSNILQSGKWVFVVLVIILLLSLISIPASFVMMFFSLFLGLKIFALAMLFSFICVALILIYKDILDWAIESSEDLLSEKIKQLHAEMDAIINQFKKDSTIAE